MDDVKDIEGIVAEFDQQEFFQGNFLHGRTGFADGAGVIGDVKDWLRTTLTDYGKQQYEAGREEGYDTSSAAKTYSKIKAYEKGRAAALEEVEKVVKNYKFPQGEHSCEWKTTFADLLSAISQLKG